MNILFHPALNDIIGTSKFSVPSVPAIEDGLNPIRFGPFHTRQIWKSLVDPDKADRKKR